MLYIVSEVFLKDWDDRDGAKILMVADNTQDVVSMLKNLESHVENNIFIKEIGNTQTPLNALININVMNKSSSDMADMTVKDFLQTYDVVLEKKLKKNTI